MKIYNLYIRTIHKKDGQIWLFFVCLFVCLVCLLFCNISLLWKRDHCRRRAAKGSPMLGICGLSERFKRRNGFLGCHQKDCHNSVALHNKQGVSRTYSNLDLKIFILFQTANLMYIKLALKYSLIPVYCS